MLQTTTKNTSTSNAKNGASSVDTSASTVTTCPSQTTAAASKKVYVGLSGGVDSALSAALLVEQGYDVRAIYMRNWSQDLPGFHCPWADDLADAERVAVQLGIDLEVWDCEADYKKSVVDYLVKAYAQGFTPNPDVMCNQTIKFGTFLDKALADGADYIATGHYARLDRQTAPQARLMRAADEHKDQTYFLWRVAAEKFSRVLFPIGDISSKQRVREMCEERQLSIATKPDSDGICFIGPVGLRTFLLESLDQKAGDIIEWETGRILGTHDGAFLFTIGQRKGLNLGGGPARYVVKTDVKKNIVYVSEKQHGEALMSSRLYLTDCHWISGGAPAETSYLIRTRHTGKLKKGRLQLLGEHKSDSLLPQACVYFEDKQEKVAPGQSVVIYDGLVCVGGGIAIEDPAESERSFHL